MNFNSHILAATAVFFAALAPASVSRTLASSPDYTRSVNRSLQSVVSSVEKAARTNGFKVSGHHDVAASLLKAGISREPYTVLEMCNAKMASSVLLAEPRLGAIMPCRIAVYRQNGHTLVTTILPSRLAAQFRNRQAVAAARPVDHALRLVISEAVR